MARQSPDLALNFRSHTQAKSFSLLCFLLRATVFPFSAAAAIRWAVNDTFTFTFFRISTEIKWSEKEEKTFSSVIRQIDWVVFGAEKFAFHLQRVFPWQLFSLSLESWSSALESRGKVTRLPSVSAASKHACMQKMKEALKLISRPLRLPNDDDGQFSNRFLLVRQKNSFERVHWSEAWGNFQDSEIETRFTANYWLNLISSREKSSPKKDKTSSKIFSFVRSPRLRFAHATTTEAKAEGKKCLQLDVRERKLEMPLTKCVWWLRTDAKSSPFAELR